MRKYTVKLKKSAIKELRELPSKEISRISKLIKKLSTNPRPSGCKN